MVSADLQYSLFALRGLCKSLLVSSGFCMSPVVSSGLSRSSVFFSGFFRSQAVSTGLQRSLLVSSSVFCCAMVCTSLQGSPVVTSGLQPFLLVYAGSVIPVSLKWYLVVSGGPRWSSVIFSGLCPFFSDLCLSLVIYGGFQ